MQSTIDRHIFWLLEGINDFLHSLGKPLRGRSFDEETDKALARIEEGRAFRLMGGISCVEEIGTDLAGPVQSTSPLDIIPSFPFRPGFPLLQLLQFPLTDQRHLQLHTVPSGSFGSCRPPRFSGHRT